MRPGSGAPYILGSFPKRPSVSIFCVMMDDGEARRRLGIGELGSCGVVGHGGVDSLSPLAKMELVEPSGSNMADLLQVSLEQPPPAHKVNYVITRPCIVLRYLNRSTAVINKL